MGVILNDLSITFIFIRKTSKKTVLQKWSLLSGYVFVSCESGQPQQNLETHIGEWEVGAGEWEVGAGGEKSDAPKRKQVGKWYGAVLSFEVK